MRLSRSSCERPRSRRIRGKLGDRVWVGLLVGPRLDWSARNPWSGLVGQLRRFAGASLHRLISDRQHGKQLTIALGDGESLEMGVWFMGQTRVTVSTGPFLENKRPLLRGGPHD